MSISTSVGLFSGIDTGALIQQLLAIEARPQQLAQNRILELQQQQAAYLSINSSLLGLKTAAGAFNTDKLFDTNLATSSNADAVSATASTSANEGSYTFQVQRLVSTQQQLSRGFADQDISGLGAESFSFELGGGAISTETTLAELNGGLGVSRGDIVITDRSGAQATVDLSTAATIDDVINTINAAGGVSVEASVSGDALTITDTSGGGGSLTIGNGFGSTTASSLGIEGSVGADELTGSRIRFASGITALSSLNDGIGVQIRDGSTDLKITSKDGTILNIDLGKITDEVDDETVTVRTRATTLQDVADVINASAAEANGGAGIDIVASVTQDGLQVIDNTGGGGNFIIESQEGRTTAADLGIDTGEVGLAGTTVVGQRLIAGINSVLTRNLNGGSGLSGNELTIEDRTGASTTITLSNAALSGSLSDIVNEINTQAEAGGIAVRAGFNRAGNGISLIDSSAGAGSLVVSGSAAADLGIETTGEAASTLNGSNLQLRWISAGTRLEDLRLGEGIGTGEIRITDSSGNSATAEIGSTLETVADLISFLESRPGIDIEVDINDNGDGIVIRDIAGGGGDLVIEDVSGTVARDLNVRGTFSEEGGVLEADGSYERVVEFASTDTLEDVVRKINEESVGVAATIINDGGGANSYRISLTSRFSGADGRAIIDTGNLDLGLTTLSKGEDALVFFGSSDPASAVLLTSSDNTLDDVVAGVTIDLKTTTSEPIEITVTRDTSAVEEAIESFISSYNDVISAIDAQSFFNAETNSRGVLLGDTTANNVRNSLSRVIQGEGIGIEGQFQRLFQVGVSIGSGSQLEFDRDRFRSALEADFTNVKDLFSASTRIASEPIELAPGITTPNTEESYSQRGVAELIKQLTDDLTNSIDGVLTLRNQTIDTQIDIQEDRVEALGIQLDNRRTQLEREFIAMEQAIASLQSQQGALASIQTLG
ncbi:MAG: flagellar filament capping protein FliD [Planctomycetota bacterium]